MKNRIVKIMGLALTLALLASLLIAAVPASAGTLAWTSEAGPNPVMNPGGYGDLTITSLATSGDGTIYVGTGATAIDTNNPDNPYTIWKSTNGGMAWANKDVAANHVTIDTDMVAVAVDDANYVATSDGSDIYISTNGGNSWGDTGFPTASSGATVKGMDISAAGPEHVLAVAADDGDVYYRNLSAVGSWASSSPHMGGSGNVTLAVKFSPNFAADAVMTAVVATATSTYFELASFSGPTPSWGSDAALDSESQIGDTIVATSAVITLDPNYLGSDTGRIAFVGTICATTSDNGIYRLEDTNSATLRTGADYDIYSIAYDGATLVAGLTGSNVVLRSLNPTDSSPSFASSNTAKGPGYEGNDVSVGFYDTTVVAGTSGEDSAFAVSTDNGVSFNDVALVQTSITNSKDLAVSPDGSVLYLVTNNGTSNPYTSLWRSVSGAWQRVLTLASSDDLIVRISASNPDIVYVADTSASAYIYYSKDGGTTKWYRRAAKQVSDLAVESDTVAYYVSGANCFRTANGAFTWGPPTQVYGNASSVYSLTLIGEGQLIAGGVGGSVGWSSDSNASWSGAGGTNGPAGNAVVTASGTATGDFVYAADSSGYVIYWTIGDSPATGYWKGLGDGTPAVASTVSGGYGSGIALAGGVLYASTTNGTGADDYSDVVRDTGAPHAPSGTIPAVNRSIATAPTALRVSTTEGYNKLWFVDNSPGGPGSHGQTIYSFTDTLVTVTPAATIPSAGAKVSVNPLNGEAYRVAFSWNHVEGATGYNLQINLDEAGTQSVYDYINSHGGGPATTGPSGNTIGGHPGVISYVPTASEVSYMPGTTYYWRVQVTNPISSGWSPARSFTVEAAGVLAPEIGSPANGATITSTTPSFSWSQISGTTSYQFQLTDDSAFVLYLVDTAVSVPTYQVYDTPLEVGKTYFWRVKAAAPSASDWSTIGTFTVVAPPVTTTAAPTINVPSITVPPVTVPPASVTVNVPEQPAPTISSGLLWAVIVIGAVLVIALIVLIIRTRRSV
jgi:hypothetical protein